MYVVRDRCVFSVCWLGYLVSFGSRLFLFGFRPGSWFFVFLWCICVWCRSEMPLCLCKGLVLVLVLHNCDSLIV
jgi:hypothetical protein